MKLYILLLDNKVFAITEYKYQMKIFIIQNNLHSSQYRLNKLTDKKIINKYLIKYEDLYLIEYNNFIIRNKDLFYIEDILYQYEKNIIQTINNLESINISCIMSPKDHSIISNCINLLDEKMKKKNIHEFINSSNVIRDYFNMHQMRHNLQDMNDLYQYYLKKE